jgi:hypothetical protein
MFLCFVSFSLNMMSRLSPTLIFQTKLLKTKWHGIPRGMGSL